MKRLLMSAVLAALAGCAAVGPDYHLPAQAVAARPQAAAPFASADASTFTAAPLPPQWWRLYQDSTLDALVAKALANNTDLRVAAANLRRASAALDEAHEKRRPEVEMSASPGYGRVAGASIGVPEALPDTGLYSADLKVSYQLDLFGRLQRGIEAAQADQEAIQAALDVARVSVVADTARAYVEACAAGMQLKTARASVALQERFASLNAQRVRMGRGTALDDSRAQAQLAQLRAALPPLEAQRRTALYRLAVLTGEVPAAFPAAVAQCEATPRVAGAVPVGDGAALLKRRPDIRQAERSLAAATARIGVATSELYPHIALGASVGSMGMIPGIGEANTFHYALGPLISWNLPATSSARVHIAQAEAGTAAALARFDGVVLGALRETETALTIYARELDRNAALRQAREHSARAAQQAQQLFQRGRADFLVALDAERELASADRSLAASDAALAADQVALFLALGGGWDIPHS